MSQERYEKTSAKRALDLYRSFVMHEDLKGKIGNNNRTLIVLSIIAYFGSCTKTRLKKAIPVTSLDLVINELIKLEYITKKKEGNEVRYFIGHSFDFTRETDTVSDENYFLFANTLMNVSAYIKSYRITSWNIMSLMLEIAWKFDKDSVDLGSTDIKSITGLYANKMSIRKQLEEMGVIKNTTPNTPNRARSSKFKVNKEAYIIEAK